MKLFIQFCLVLICSAFSLAQPILKNWDTGLLPQGYPVQFHLNNVSEAGFTNPSFLSLYNGISAGISYQYGFTINNAYIGGMMGKSIVNGLPYSAALSCQAGALHFGAAIRQRYNLRIDSGPIDILTVENPNGTGKKTQLIMDRDIHDYSLMSSYQINNFPERNTLSLGLRLSLGILNYNDHPSALASMPSIETSVYAVGFALGADYKLALSNGDLRIGAYFEKGLDFRKDVLLGPDKTSYTGPNGQIYHILASSFRIEIYTPDAVSLNLSLGLPKVQITANLSEVLWNSVSDTYRNNLDFSTGANYKTSDWLSLFFGASMNDRKYSDSHPDYFRKDYNALFLTLGADAVYGNYTFGLSVSDSHLFSSESRRQTIARLTLGYQF